MFDACNSQILNEKRCIFALIKNHFRLISNVKSFSRLQETFPKMNTKSVDYAKFEKPLEPNFKFEFFFKIDAKNMP